MNQTPQRPPEVLSDASVDELLRDTTPWLSCEECFERMDAYAEAVARGLSAHDQAMDRHLGACPACDEEARSLIELLQAD
ncbi:hypothetical protein [Terrabacter carboxydivorans]|uniref:Zinc-finger domain-containing protein n=1 Tax=Terrabacter carboxydivorans TaxID=619730 RepID=A0ABP5ZIK3_9MICO